MPATEASTDGPPEANQVDFHLVESRDGWSLTIRLTDRLRRQLIGSGGQETQRGSDEPGTTYTVLVEPNLLPAEPFRTDLLVE